MTTREDVDIYVNFLIDQANRGRATESIDALEQEFQAFENIIKSMKQEVTGLIQVTERFTRTSTLLLAGGTAIAGGIFSFASKYVKDAKVATETTEKWKDAQESLAESGSRAGEVLATAALPLLEKAAELADKAAGFVEDNPEIVRAALNTGVVLAGLGAVGVAVSKGIRFYADYLYLAAITKEAQGFALFDKSVNKFLAATAKGVGGLPSGGGALSTGGKVAGGGGLAAAGSVVGSILALLAAAFAGGVIGDKIGAALAQRINPEDTAQYKFSDYVNIYKQATAINAFKLGNLIGGQEKGNKAFEAVARFLGLKDKAEVADSEKKDISVTGSEAFDSILKAYEKYKQDDLAAVQKHYADRQKIIDDSLKAERDATRQYQESIRKVNADTGSSLRQVTASFQAAEEKAERDYAIRRAEIVRGAGEEIEKIENDLREKLRKLATDHSERMDNLVRGRDALGLVKEQRRYDQERGEAIRQANEEIRQRRRDIAIRLADLARSFAIEREQRLLEYQARVSEIHAQAAARLRELAIQHRDELIAIRKQRVDKLKEIDSQYAEERKRKYQAFLQTIRDLDASLLGEKQLKERYYKEMTADLDAFLANYREGLKTLQSNPASRAAGGYATYGQYVLGDSASGGRGRPEFVLSGNTTSIAERALGGTLTQERMIAALSMGGGGQNVNYTDNRRMPSQGPIDREALRKDMQDILQKELKHAFR